MKKALNFFVPVGRLHRQSLYAARAKRLPE
jgi:hypothetical protein